jgi:hypothetical protein
MSAPAAAVGAREQALAAGLVEGEDFVVAGLTSRMGSECVVLAGRGDRVLVLYADMGTERVLASTASFDDAVAVFLAEAAWLAADRERGPFRGRTRVLPTLGSDEDAVRAYEERLAHL